MKTAGLANEELALANLLTGVPMQADYPSLNLGQAVMVYCYQLAALMNVRVAQQPPANIGQLNALRQRAEELFSVLGSVVIKIVRLGAPTAGGTATAGYSYAAQDVYDIEKLAK